MELTTMTHPTSRVRRARTETLLLGLFSTVPERCVPSADPPSRIDRALWAADALHRANNLSQMSASLVSPGVRRRFGPIIDSHVSRARALSRAYAELGEGGSCTALPCAPLLTAIVERLIALFGEERAIHAHVAADPVTLSQDQRRALTLIASELVINALKYAFPDGRPGLIVVTLRRADRHTILSVADNGRGPPPGAATGQGQGTLLMARLCALLDADMHRQSDSGGYRVTVSVPQDA